MIRRSEGSYDQRIRGISVFESAIISYYKCCDPLFSSPSEHAIFTPMVRKLKKKVITITTESTKTI